MASMIFKGTLGLVPLEKLFLAMQVRRNSHLTFALAFSLKIWWSDRLDLFQEDKKVRGQLLLVSDEIAINLHDGSPI